MACLLEYGTREADVLIPHDVLFWGLREGREDHKYGGIYPLLFRPVSNAVSIKTTKAYYNLYQATLLEVQDTKQGLIRFKVVIRKTVDVRSDHQHQLHRQMNIT